MILFFNWHPFSRPSLVRFARKKIAIFFENWYHSTLWIEATSLCSEYVLNLGPWVRWQRVDISDVVFMTNGISIQSIRRNLKTRLTYYRAVYQHPRTPRLSKVLLWIALGYLLSPIDIIPDFIPVLGHLDDLVIVPLLIFLALRLIPDEVLSECNHPEPATFK